jgi:phosphatidylserine decarboxylase
VKSLNAIPALNHRLHQYVDRASNTIQTERLIADPFIAWLYSPRREQNSYLFRLATSRLMTGLLAYLNYDAPIASRFFSASRILEQLGIDTNELVAPFTKNPSVRDVFERQIRYGECRPLPADPRRIVSPSDAKMLIGNFSDHRLLPVKEKFFTLEELLSPEKTQWRDRFDRSDWGIFRLTAEKYHYNHLPVTGKLADFYEIDGSYHSCNPAAVIQVVTPYSKNRRSVTIIDTDVDGGSGAGLVAMIEIAALMIGEIQQCYCADGYGPATTPRLGMTMTRGAVKSFFRPGSSTVILLFEHDRIRVDSDLLTNSVRRDVVTRYCAGFGKPFVETDVRARSAIATPSLQHTLGARS